MVNVKLISDSPGNSSFVSEHTGLVKKLRHEKLEGSQKGKIAPFFWCNSLNLQWSWPICSQKYSASPSQVLPNMFGVRSITTLYDNTRRNLKQRWGILTTENLLTTIVTCQFLVNTVFPYSGLLQL